MYAWGEADFFSPNVMVSEGLGMALSGTEYSQENWVGVMSKMTWKRASASGERVSLK